MKSLLRHFLNRIGRAMLTDMLDKLKRDEQIMLDEALDKLKRDEQIMLDEALDDHDLKKELQKISTHKTACYIERQMSGVQSVKSWENVHDVAIKNITIADGLIMEFGVFYGRTINYIASKVPGIVDGFDSFEGLPESWRDGFDKGCFSVDDLPKVNSNVRLHIGWFENTIPKFIESDFNRDRMIAYLHIDCDLYSSTKTIFELVGKRITKGTVIVFDEYFNYDGWEKGEFLAFMEFIESSGLSYEYLTYNSKHEQVAVFIR